MSDFLTTLGYGGKVAVIGMLIVFAGLILLIVILSLMSQLFKTFDKSGAQKETEQAAAPVEAAPVIEEADEEVVDDTELIAVIAAAISAYEQEGKKLIVRKVRRVSGWNRAAREEQMPRF